MNQWLSAWVSGWINRSMNPWINEPMNQWMKEWVDGRVTFLCWATSSLSDLFAEAPLLSATSSQSSHLSGLLLLRAASQPLAQLQSRLPGASQHHPCLAARSRANVTAGCKPLAQIRGCSKHDGYWGSLFEIQLLSLVRILRTWSAKSDTGLQRSNFWPNPSLAAISRFFCRHRAPHPRKQRSYFGDPRSHFTRQIAWFRALDCFHAWIHVFRK